MSPIHLRLKILPKVISYNTTFFTKVSMQVVQNVRSYLATWTFLTKVSMQVVQNVRSYLTTWTFLTKVSMKVVQNGRSYITTWTFLTKSNNASIARRIECYTAEISMQVVYLSCQKLQLHMNMNSPHFYDVSRTPRSSNSAGKPSFILNLTYCLSDCFQWRQFVGQQSITLQIYLDGKIYRNLITLGVRN